jgi:3-phenylpropionate/trans-cinnamate dioxygenase ferredoxin subunit
MADVTIRATPNGPYIVQGQIELRDTGGDEYPLDKESIALCRCGHSNNKPLCDGTHSKIGFKATERVADLKGST